jgi:hypothetical protein
MRSRAAPLEGRRFYALTVVRRAGRKQRAAAWLCRCDCGEEIIVRSDVLHQGRKKTCGIAGHYWGDFGLGKLNWPEYRCWAKMRDRCLNPARKKYETYGGRGIRICERWDRFANFLEDMGKKPSPKHSIDRKDVNGNYEPGNCRWATNGEQQRNRRDSVHVMYRKKRVLLIELCEKKGWNYITVLSRYNKGWSLRRASTVPVRNYVSRGVTNKGEPAFLVGLCKQHGLKYSVVYARLQLGWTLQEALTIPLHTHRKRFHRENILEPA